MLFIAFFNCMTGRLIPPNPPKCRPGHKNLENWATRHEEHTQEEWG